MAELRPAARRAARIVALALVLSGCSGIPTGGEAREVAREIPGGPRADDPVVIRVQAAPPQADFTPVEMVKGFLDAQADPGEAHAVARRYLAPGVPWSDQAGVVLYTSRSVTERVRADRATVTVTLQSTGTISPVGEYRNRPQSLVQRYELAQLGGQWLLSEAPDGLHLTPGTLSQSFRRVTLYYPHPVRRALVPDEVFLPASEPRTTTLVRALIAGPGAWLRPAVRNAFPPEAELIRDATVVDGVAELDFSREVLAAPPDALVAQLVWTLALSGSGVDGVRVSVEGRQLKVAGRTDGRVERRSAWADYDPTAPAGDDRPYFVRHGQLFRYGDGEQPPAPVRRDTDRLSAIAVDRSGQLAALQAGPGGRTSLVLGPVTGDLRQGLAPGRLTPPTWTGGDRVWTVRQDDGSPQVLEVPADSRLPTPLPVRSRLRAGQRVQSLRLSPDGARAALVIGIGRARRLFVARVEVGPKGASTLAAPRGVSPELTDVSAAEWTGGAGLAVVAAGPGGAGLHRVQSDGFGLAVLGQQGLPARPEALAAGAGRPLLVVVGGVIYRRDALGTWTRLTEGEHPAYAG